MFLLSLSVGNTIKDIDFIVGALALIIFAVIITIFFKRKFVLIINWGMCVILITLQLFELHTASLLFLFGYMTFIIVTSIINAGIFRAILANIKNNFSSHHSTPTVVENKTIDRQALIKELSEAITNLSKTKTGALITFEKKDSLDEYIKTGTTINSPITKEIIQTIFYPGTRLHDGAIVIRNGLIVSASVYYTPTTKPLSGKYGARHRAALGISEVTDSVTIIVSEETGRISIAVDGVLSPVTLDTIERNLNDNTVFENN